MGSSPASASSLADWCSATTSATWSRIVSAGFKCLARILEDHRDVIAADRAHPSNGGGEQVDGLLPAVVAFLAPGPSHDLHGAVTRPVMIAGRASGAVALPGR